jgi:hypothetical protein
MKERVEEKIDSFFQPDTRTIEGKRLRPEQGLGIRLSNPQKLQVSAMGPPSSLFPTPHGIRADIEKRGKHLLRSAETEANLSNLLRAKSLWPRWKFSNSQIDALACLKGRCILQSPSQIVENLNLLRHS